VKALFITTEPNDVTNVIEAWNCWNEVKAERITFDFFLPVNGTRLIRKARKVNPDVMFYIGACGAPGCYTPDVATLKTLRDIAPFINICFDAVELEWHGLLRRYKQNECFDLQVSIDGCGPVDLITLAPVVTSFYEGPGPVKDIDCGFSGNVGKGKRSFTIDPLEEEKLIKVRLRNQTGEDYDKHAAFIRRCKMIINTSFSGSARFHHVKQRISEAAFAGCSVLEMADAPRGVDY